MKVLFVCTSNMLRSPTAAFLYSQTDGVAAKSRGIDCDLTREYLDWADIIFVMEKRHRHKIRRLFPDVYDGKRIICLYLDDKYDYLDERLVAELPKKLAKWLPAPNLPSTDAIAAARLDFVTRTDWPQHPWDGL